MDVDPFDMPLASHDMGFDTPTTQETKIMKEKTCKKKGCKKCDNEKVNSPAHYNVGKIEVIDAIEEWKLGFNDGNAIKYIARHQHKGKAIQDIEKAIWYLNRHLTYLKEAARKE